MVPTAIRRLCRQCALRATLRARSVGWVGVQRRSYLVLSRRRPRLARPLGRGELAETDGPYGQTRDKPETDEGARGHEHAASGHSARHLRLQLAGEAAAARRAPRGWPGRAVERSGALLQGRERERASESEEETAADSLSAPCLRAGALVLGSAPSSSVRNGRSTGSAKVGRGRLVGPGEQRG
jgi:hypothetical protein